MEPLRPEDKEAALNESPVPDAAELMQEYEHLLAERFNQDPDMPVGAAPESVDVELRGAASDREERLKQLHQKLFPRSDDRVTMNDQRVFETVNELIIDYAPAEELSLSGVWDDYSASNGAEPIPQEIEAFGNRFGWAAPGLPLFSAVIIPMALWTAKRLGEKAADKALKEVIGKIREWLGIKRKTATVTLTDEQIDKIANVLVLKLRSTNEAGPAAKQRET